MRRKRETTARFDLDATDVPVLSVCPSPKTHLSEHVPENSVLTFVLAGVLTNRDT
jgi:hypothetical protein